MTKTHSHTDTDKSGKSRLKLALQETEMFHKVLEGMQEDLPLEGMLKRIVKSVVVGLGYDRAGIFLLSTDRKTLDHSMGIDEKGRFESHRYPFAVKRKKGFSIFSDIANGYLDHFFTNNIQKKLNKANVSKGVLCNANVPIRRGSHKIIGVMAVDNLFTQRRLTMSDILSLNGFAIQVGVAIESIRMHEHIRASNRDLVKLSKVKDGFLSIVSHELRTPLTSIMGYLKLLSLQSMGPLNETQKDFVETVRRNSERLYRIVNDLLDLSRYEAGTQELLLSPAHPMDILSAAYQTVQNMAANKRIQLVLEPALSMGPIRVNAPKMESVFINLLGNAIKFTPEGGKVTASCREIMIGGQRGIEFIIADSGIGIPRKLFDKVFDKFYQVENPMTRSAGGSGLGLSICKHIVEAHGGSINLESELGKGTTFRVFIPEKRAKKKDDDLTRDQDVSPS